MGVDISRVRGELVGLRSLAWAAYCAVVSIVGEDGVCRVPGSGVPAGRREVRGLLTDGFRLKRPRSLEVDEAFEDLVRRGLLVEGMDAQERGFIRVVDRGAPEGAHSGSAGTAQRQHSGITAASQRQHSGNLGPPGQSGITAASVEVVESQRLTATFGELVADRGVSLGGGERGGGVEGLLSIYIGSCSVVVPAEGSREGRGGDGSGVEAPLPLAPCSSRAGGNRTEQRTGVPGSPVGSAAVGEPGVVAGTTEPNTPPGVVVSVPGDAGSSVGASPARDEQGANGRGAVWRPPDRRTLTEWVEKTAALTGDLDSKAGFRSHIRQLCVTREGQRAFVAVMRELQDRLARGEVIPEGCVRGKWVTTRLMRALKDLGLAPERRGVMR